MNNNIDWRHFWGALIFSQLVAIGTATLVNVIAFFFEDKFILKAYPLLMSSVFVVFIFVVLIAFVCDKFDI